jgi:hypothetical protein
MTGVWWSRGRHGGLRLLDDGGYLRHRAQSSARAGYYFDPAAHLAGQLGGAAFAGIKQNQYFGHAVKLRENNRGGARRQRSLWVECNARARPRPPALYSEVS